MNAKVKTIIESYKDDLDTNNFENIVRHAAREEVLEDLLNVMFEAGIEVSPNVVAKCLCEKYIPNWSSLTADERAKKELQVNYMINKNQIAIFKALL